MFAECLNRAILVSFLRSTNGKDCLCHHLYLGLGVTNRWRQETALVYQVANFCFSMGKQHCHIWCLAQDWTTSFCSVHRPFFSPCIHQRKFRHLSLQLDAIKNGHFLGFNKVLDSFGGLGKLGHNLPTPSRRPNYAHLALFLQ